MTLVEALEKGLKKINEPGNQAYLSVEDDGNLIWRSKSTNEPVEPEHQGLRADQILQDYWLPYEEPEKCDACKEADAALARGISTSIVLLADHLRKYHCTCGGKR